MCLTNLNNSCIDENLNDTDKEIIELYPDYNINGMKDSKFIYFKLGVFTDIIENMTDIDNDAQYYLNKYYQTDTQLGGTKIEQYFLKNNKEKAIEILNGKVNDEDIYYMPQLYSPFHIKLIFSNAIIITAIIIILSIAFSFSYDYSSKVDYLILTSKEGRKIIKSKLVAVSLASILYSTMMFVPLLLIYMKYTGLYYYLSTPINYFNSQLFYWYNFNFIEIFLLLYLLILFTHLFIGLFTSVIAIYSKKVLNIIIYSVIIMTVIIVFVNQYQVEGAKSNFNQIINILLVHTPFGFLWVHFEMLRFDPSSVIYNNFTYESYPLVYILVNVLVISFLYLLGIRHYQRENL